VIDALSPLIDWLDLKGVDLLCLSPPPEVSTVPMHMLEWHGQSLIERVGVVQVPSAELLTAGAREHALRGDLSKASVFSVPRAGPRGEQERRAFDRVAAAVRSGIPDLETLGASRVDRDLLTNSDLTNRLIHFSCHGHFDPLSPLKRSGIFIADHGELPTTAEQDRFILTAEDAAGLQVSGSHVTLSACVCGRSSQITPGEALGMIWGFLRGRAISVLGACWNADREATADLIKRFYQLWLGKEHIPKWRALQQAICELKVDRGRSHPYFWAPFVLYGYWN
jgi:CHAT domain-containing protein